MKMRWSLAIILGLGSLVAAAAGPAGPPADAFVAAIAQHCGKAYAGRITANEPAAPNDPFANKPLVMHVLSCDPQQLRIPFHVGDDHARTWVITRTASGLQLKHDHRHEDGSPDMLTMYGGDTTTAGTATRQEFPVDAESRALFEREGSKASVTNTWAMEIVPGKRFAYELARPGRLFRVEFDLTQPVATPPLPWGAGAAQSLAAAPPAAARPDYATAIAADYERSLGALQSLISREKGPLDPGVITVGAFHAGTKHNIISERAELQLTVRANSKATRDALVAGVERVARNTALAHGIAEDRLPQVRIVESTPPTLNDPALARRLNTAIAAALGPEVVQPFEQTSMGAEDFAHFVAPALGVPGYYFAVGGTSQAVIDAAAAGGPRVPPHHSPLFRIEPEPAVRTGAEAMVTAVLELLAPR